MSESADQTPGDKTLHIESRSLEPGLLDERRFWVVLDATPTTAIPRRLAEEGVESVSLYKGEADEKYWDIAPYLARLDEELYQWIRYDLQNIHWGIALTCEGSLEDLRRHFRKFLMVKDTQGNKMYFRFYDPRVLPVFLQTCKEKELAEMFGPIEEYWAKEEGTDLFRVCRMGAPEQAGSDGADEDEEAEEAAGAARRSEGE